MPSPRTAILLVGSDAALLETRRMLLERTGARVWTSLSVAGFDRIPPAEPIALLVLCHSLSGEQRDRALALAMDRWNPLESLALVSGSFGCAPAQGARVVDAHQGPAVLLETVSNLLKRAC